MKFLEEVENLLHNKIKKLGAEANVSLSFSDRPELCDFQTNVAFSLSKILKKSPIMIANEIVENMENENFEIFAVAPGFINVKLKDKMLSKILEELYNDPRVGIEKIENKKVLIDYGGPNIAKPLHVGHLRSAIIGETIKRLCRFVGNDVTSDVHLGDWGLQMGLVIAGIMEKYDCKYFFTGEGKKPCFDFEELAGIYPESSARSKVDEEFKARAKEITVKLQQKEKGYYDLWNEIKNISIDDIKKIYKILNVDFELWNGESDSEPYIKNVFEILSEKNLIEKSEGAEIVNVERETDTSPMPPLIVRSSAGAELYATTELATIISRVQNYSPEEIIYLTDNRQSLHFNQVFRVCSLAGIAENAKLTHITFGTVNGKDGKPFKTRDGGTMYLSDLIEMVKDACRKKLLENQKIEDDQIEKLAEQIGISALKFGDMINYPSKDYIFDIPKFCSFEGKTGPYMQYSIVRINSILDKAKDFEPCFEIVNQETREVIINLLKFAKDVVCAYRDYAPNIFVQSAYNLASSFSTLYNKTNILNEVDKNKRNSLLTLIKTVKTALQIFAELLAIDIPKKM